METLDNIIYEKINLTTYERRIQNIIKNKSLKELGLRITKLGKTYYNYPIELIQIGKGEQEIFIVGGTHSSETITVDFTTQLLNNLPEEFNPNIFRLNIIPLQNPEGFDINTSILENIKTVDFEKKSKEYYLRYRTDSLIYIVLKELNCMDFNIQNLKQYMETKHWKDLEKNNAIPKITILKDKLKKKIKTADILLSIKETLEYADKKNIHDIFLIKFLYYLSELTIKKIDLNNLSKLHQEQFKNIEIDKLKIRNKNLSNKIKEIYQFNPQGSIVNHDSNGLFVNLNSNQPENKGIEILKQKKTIYMTGTKSNLKNYYKGPVGLPCINPNNFEYAVENQILYNLIKESQEKNKYVATLLYHSTGGMIYYKPNNEKFINYNKELANSYNEGIYNYNNTQYKIIEQQTQGGFGDMLRSKFKGVLLIELSKMGGNPIGPYGDKENIYRTINENISGINSLFKCLKKSNY